jgi:hypothetical protein
MPSIVVKISKIGDAKVEVNGEVGSACILATAAVEAALGGTQQSREFKPEYNEVTIEQTVENG